jgi:cysteine synthase A
MKNYQDNLIQGIGNTPLIKLRAASEITGCNIYGKAEFMNASGSVKDRAALALIRDAEEKKLISKGGTIVEGTAGNTGIGLCLLGNSLGYKTIIVMNDNQTQEKKDLLRNIGADLRLVPPKPYKDDANFVKVAARLADELRPSNNNGVYGLINLIMLQMLKVITKEPEEKFGNKQKVKWMLLYVHLELVEQSLV